MRSADGGCRRPPRTSQLGRVAVLLAVAADGVVADDHLPPGGAGGEVGLQLGQVGAPRLLQQTPCVQSHAT